MGGFGLGLRCLLRALTDAEFRERVAKLFEPPAKELEAKPARISAEAVALLSLLQREGRLVDFLLEDISGFEDAQIGAAVRGVHQGCRRVLDEFFDPRPILAGEEGAVVTVPADFDPAAVQLQGEVVGDPPFSGTLRHHGWRVSKGELPGRPAAADPRVVAAAEVEIGERPAPRR